MGWLSLLFGLADPIAKITQAVVQAKKDARNAATEDERIAADERVKTLEARRDVLMADSRSSKVDMFVRLFLALPPGLLLWKVYVYDKALGQWTHGRTDALSPELWYGIWIVLGFYFLYEMKARR